MKRRSWQVAVAAGLWLVCAVAIASGQDIFQGEGGATIGGGASRTMSTWPLQVAAVIVIAITAFALAFFVIFPSMLKRSRPPWPREAYGKCWSLVVVVTSLAILGIFWNELVLTVLFPGMKASVPDLVNHYALKVVLILLTLLAVMLNMVRYHSEGRASLATSHS